MARSQATITSSGLITASGIRLTSGSLSAVQATTPTLALRALAADRAGAATTATLALRAVSADRSTTASFADRATTATAALNVPTDVMRRADYDQDADGYVSHALHAVHADLATTAVTALTIRTEIAATTHALVADFATSASLVPTGEGLKWSEGLLISDGLLKTTNFSGTNISGPYNNLVIAFDNALHGQRGGGNLHALATPSSSGFMSKDDKAKLDGLTGTGALAAYTRIYDGANTAVAESAGATLRLKASSLIAPLVMDNDPILGDTLQFNFIPSALNLGQLGNLSVASPASGDYLGYDGASQKWINKPVTESDPVFAGSVAKNIAAPDIARWNSALQSYSETDPLFTASSAKNITSSDIALWNSALQSYSETDPLFTASSAKSITSSDISRWNSALQSYTETDPVFGTSAAKGITTADISRWNTALQSYTEMDPAFTASIAKNITASDISRWNGALQSYTETDPVFAASAAKGITTADITRWNSAPQAANETDPTISTWIKNISQADIMKWNAGTGGGANQVTSSSFAGFTGIGNSFAPARIVIAGSVAPDSTGVYVASGLLGAYPAYRREADGMFWVWWDGARWVLTASPGVLAGAWWTGGGELASTMSAAGTASGAPTLADVYDRLTLSFNAQGQ